MAYLGRGIENLSDRVVLDSLTASATASYTLQLDSVNFVPSSAESLTVSLNGVIQAPISSYTVSGSTLTFASALTSSDSIDFIIAERGITLQTPSAGSVGTSQLASNAVTAAKINDGEITNAKISSTAGIATTKLGTGAVLQVVSTTKTDDFVTTAGGSSPVAITGLTASITPSSTSSKILVIPSLNVGMADNNHVSITLFRDTTAVGIGDASGVRPRASFTGTVYASGNTWNMQCASFNFLDSPSTTSSTTYSLKIGGNGSTQIRINKAGRDSNGTNEDGRYASTITLMEIAG